MVAHLGRPSTAKLLLLLAASWSSLVASAPSLAACADEDADGVDGAPQFVVQAAELQPPNPKAGEPLSVHVELLLADGDLHGVEHLRASAQVTFCRRLDDCMQLFSLEDTLCALANLSVADCSSVFKAGDKVTIERTLDVPLDIFRGAYDVLLRVHDKKGDVLACSTLSSVVVTTRVLSSHLCDIRDALIAFGVAASSSRQLGSMFPTLSYGVLPQISGFLLMGIVVGPYLTNLVTKLHIHLLGTWINHLSLAFIAGAAGLEIFFPELRELIGPMLIQVAFVTTTTIVICTGGMLAISTSGLVPVAVLTSQPSFVAQGSVALLAGSLMVARSPASAIAVITEMKCNHLSCSKIVLGVTVLSDIAVLIIFALAGSVTRVVTLGDAIGPGTFVAVFMEIVLSGLLGISAGMLVRYCVPTEDPHSHTLGTPDSEHEALLRAGSPHAIPKERWAALRGLRVIAVLFATYELAGRTADLTDDRVRLEPILACTAAACFAGHDEKRRHGMEEAMSSWTSAILLPFFTLAGASLQLPGLKAVLPAALSIVALRMLGIASGSIMAGLISQRRFPQLRITKEVVGGMWLTMLAQAGVTLGLVLEVQDSFSWGHEFGTLVIGVVVVNQLIGPVLCRVGLGAIVAAETRQPPEGDPGVTEDRTKGGRRQLLRLTTALAPP